MDLTVTLLLFLLLCALPPGLSRAFVTFSRNKSPDCGVLSISGNLGRGRGWSLVIPPRVRMSLRSSLAPWAEAVSGTCILWGHTPSLEPTALTPVYGVT